MTSAVKTRLTKTGQPVMGTMIEVHCTDDTWGTGEGCRQGIRAGRPHDGHGDPRMGRRLTEHRPTVRQRHMALGRYAVDTTII